MVQKAHGPLRSFGRIKARPIKASQAALLDTLLPRLALDLSQPFDAQALKPEASEVWLEIGFGGGEHMAAQAALRPNVLILGAEPFLNGAASALRHLNDGGIESVRLHIGDARDLLAVLPDQSLERIFILFPDPWPKARHHKRRLIQTETVRELTRTLKPDGVLRFATDWADYADWALARFLAAPDLVWMAEGPDDWRRPPADHIATRYELKRLGDIAPVYFDFRRKRDAEPSR
jgi:tRNA (guanine-N7-)-methyltransferase